MTRPIGRIPPESLVTKLVGFFAAEASIPVALVHSRDRRAAVSWVRAMTVKWLRAHEAGYSTTGIGNALGLDHTSVIHMTRRAHSLTPPKLSPRGVLRPPKLVIVMPPRNKRLGERIMSLVRGYESTDCKIVPEEIANRLRVSQSNAAEALRRLYNAGRIARIGHGSYRPLARPKPVAVAPSAASTSFIRPIPLARLMGSR